MAGFHVFVDGAADDTPAGVARLAEAIAKHYGLPPADLLARLQRGRFRVKTNTDRGSAETYMRDLVKLGARCTIEEATAANSQRTTPIPFAAVAPPAESRTTTPPSGLAAAGSPAASRTTTPASGLKPAAAGAEFQSGLSAAFSGQMPAADLGALGREDAAFSLASVDGADDSKPHAEGAFAPPGGGALPASIGPAPDKPKPASAAAAARPAKPKDEPLDMFAPPEMQGDEFRVDIADDEKDVSARKRASTPPPAEEPPATRPSSQKIPTPPASQRISTTPAQGTPSGAAAGGSQPALAIPDAAAGVVAPNRFGPLAEPRVRFAAGVVLAVLLGFVPAHFVAKMREESTSAEVDRKVIAAQQLADSPEVYATLDSLRADQLARKESEQRNAAIIGFAIWALVGAGIAFVWFRKIPWDG